MGNPDQAWPSQSRFSQKINCSDERHELPGRCCWLYAWEICMPSIRLGDRHGTPGARAIYTSLVNRPKNLLEKIQQRPCCKLGEKCMAPAGGKCQDAIDRSREPALTPACRKAPWWSCGYEAQIWPCNSQEGSGTQEKADDGVLSINKK